MLDRLRLCPSLLLVVSTLCWSGNFVIGRAIHERIPPIGLSFWRWSIALMLVLSLAWPQVRRDMPRLLLSWPIVLALAVLGVATFNTLVYLGLASTTVTNAVLMQSAMPVMILLGSFLLFREPVHGVQLLGVAISLAGVTVIICAGSIQRLLGLALNPGDGWVLLAVCSYALYSVLLRKRPAVHPLSFLAATFALGALILLPAYIWEHLNVRHMQIDTASLAALAYVGVFPSLLAYLCFNRAVELIGANRAGQYLHLMPLFGSLLAGLFLGERLHLYHLAGAALIGAGIALSQRYAARLTARAVAGNAGPV